MMTDIKDYFQKKKQWLYRNIYRRLSPRFFYVSPKLMASFWYAINTGRFPNLRHPQEFSELMLSLNLKARKDKRARDLRVQCADKYAVRRYVEEKGFPDILNECYGVYNSFEEIDFDKLPNQFVLKMTTGSGMNFICKDKSKLDIDSLREKVKGWFANCKDYGLKTAEWHYVEIKPRLIAEKYLSELGESLSIIDYKCHCFNGHLYHVETISDRDVQKHTNNCDTYNPQWERTDCVMPQYHTPRRMLPKPQSFEYMKKVAETLSADFEYVRVDLYEIDGKVLFGELTFTPAGCIEFDYMPWYLADMCRFYYDTKK